MCAKMTVQVTDFSGANSVHAWMVGTEMVSETLVYLNQVPAMASASAAMKVSDLTLKYSC
jgi:hypothetical protein